MENAVAVQILEPENHLDEDRPDRVLREERPALLVLRDHHRHIRLVCKVSNLLRRIKNTCENTHTHTHHVARAQDKQ